MDSISIKEFQSWKRPFGSNSENFPVPFCSKDPKGLSKIGFLSKPHSSVLAKPGLKFMFSDFSLEDYLSTTIMYLKFKTHAFTYTDSHFIFYSIYYFYAK